MASGFDMDFLAHGTGGGASAKNGVMNKPAAARMQPRSVGGSQINLRNRHKRGVNDGKAPTQKQS